VSGLRGDTAPAAPRATEATPVNVLGPASTIQPAVDARTFVAGGAGAISTTRFDNAPGTVRLAVDRAGMTEAAARGAAPASSTGNPPAEGPSAQLVLLKSRGRHVGAATHLAEHRMSVDAAKPAPDVPEPRKSPERPAAPPLATDGSSAVGGGDGRAAPPLAHAMSRLNGTMDADYLLDFLAAGGDDIAVGDNVRRAAADAVRGRRGPTGPAAPSWFQPSARAGSKPAVRGPRATVAASRGAGHAAAPPASGATSPAPLEGHSIIVPFVSPPPERARFGAARADSSVAEPAVGSSVALNITYAMLLPADAE
jgi:hypothetical protein